MTPDILARISKRFERQERYKIRKKKSVPRVYWNTDPFSSSSWNHEMFTYCAKCRQHRLLLRMGEPECFWWQERSHCNPNHFADQFIPVYKSACCAPSTCVYLGSNILRQNFKRNNNIKKRQKVVENIRKPKNTQSAQELVAKPHWRQ